MITFSSLKAAIQAGFRWHSYSDRHQLHIVELDRIGRHGKREKAMAFALPSPEDADLLEEAL